MDAFYEQAGGHFHLRDRLVQHKDGEPIRDQEGTFVYETSHSLIHSSVSVGVAYCQLPDRIHVFTHGTEEGMRKWVEAHNAHSPHKATLKIFDQNTPVGILNKAIVDPVFFTTLL